MTSTVRKIDGLDRERLLEFANGRGDAGEREALIDLAGRWKHNWIPLDEIAAAIKAKRMKGDGTRRASTPDVPRAAGKSRLDPKGAARHAAIVNGSRGKARPPRGRASAAGDGSNGAGQRAAADLAAQHASNLYDQHIHPHRDESQAHPDRLRQVAEAHVNAAHEHYKAGNTSEAAWHGSEAGRLNRMAHAGQARRDAAVDASEAHRPVSPGMPPYNPANRDRARSGEMIPNAQTPAAHAINDQARRADLVRGMKVKKETKGGNVSFVASHSNGQNTVTVRIPQQRGMTDHEHRQAAKRALLKGLERDHPGRTSESPEQTAARIGMTFPKPTVKGHAVIGEGTVEKQQDPMALPPGYRISKDPKFGPALHHNGKIIRTSSAGNEASLAAYARDHAKGDTSGHARTVQDEFTDRLKQRADSSRARAVEAGVRAPTGDDAMKTRARAATAEERRQLPGPHGERPGDVVTLTDDGVAGPRRAVYVGRDVNGRPEYRGPVNGQMATSAIEQSNYGKVKPAGKAEAAAETAAPKKPRKPSALHQEYRARREEQDRRFEAHAGGGVAATDTHTQEYKDYFGVGDHSTTPQEQRLTFKSFLEERRQGAEYERRQQQAYDTGVQLGAKHGEQDDSTHHEAEYQHAAAGHDDEMFGQGYSDGLIAGSQRAEDRRQAEADQRAKTAAADVYGHAKTAASLASNKAVRSTHAADHNSAVHAHVAAGRAALAAGDRETAQHHIKMAESHKQAADTIAKRATAQAATPDASGSAGETRRLERNQSIVLNGPNAGQVREDTSHATAGGAVEARPGDASPPADSGIRVEHTGDGTLVHGTERGDTETTSALKAQGFKWSRNLGAWYLPRTWSESTREARVRGLEARLGDKITVQRGDLAKSTSGAEERTQRIARAGELAQKHTERAGKSDAEAQRRFNAADQATAGIPFGQPILVGHHSQRRHEAALEKSHRNMAAGVNAHQDAERARERAASAAARARLEEDPKFLARRLERNRAEHRKVLRTLGRANPDDEHTQRLHAIRRDLEEKIAADQAAHVQHGGSQHSKESITPGDVITYRGDAYLVHKANTKTVTVPHWEPRLAAAGHTDTIPYSQIQQHARLDDASTGLLRKYLEKPGTPPAVKSRIAAILRDRGESTA